MLNDRIQAILNEGILNNVYGGASLLVFKNGKELVYAQAGCQSKENSTALKRDSLFRIYSMTKPVTAVAAMILVERGLLDMGAPVSKFLPGFKNQQYYENGKLLPVLEPATIAQLFSMTSGLVYPGEADASEKQMAALFDAFEQKPMSTYDFCNRMGEIPLPFAPGTTWRYGVSADVLGAVIEVVSGKSFADFLQDEIFEPLEMNDTGFFVKEENASRLATVYEPDGKGNITPYTGRNLAVGGLYEKLPPFLSGGAGLVSSIDDYMRFGQMLLLKGTCKNTRILSPETVAYMTSPQLSPLQAKTFWREPEGCNYGRLVQVRVEKGRALTLGSIGEYGWNGWLGTQFKNDPAQNLTFVFMTQRKDTPSDTLVNRLKNAVYGTL